MRVRESLDKGRKNFSKMYGPYGGVAQLGEHLLCKQGVIGSIPFISTRGQMGRTPLKRLINGLIAQVVRAHA